MQLTLLQALQTALELLRGQRFQEAEALCRQVLAAYPEQPEALHILGVIAANVGKLDVGVEMITRALAGNPNHPEYLQHLGQLLRRLKRTDEATAAFRRVVELNPTNAEAHANLGDLLFAAAHENEAVASYQRAIAARSNYAEAYNNLGLVFQRQQKIDEAIDAFSKALSLRPNFPETHTNLGNALHSKGRSAEALAAFRQAISLRPDYMLPYNSLGGVLRYLDRIDEALAAYERSLALKPDFTAAHNNRSQTLMDAGRFEEAIAGFRRTIELDPNFAEAHWNYALALLLTGDFARGWDEFEWRWRWSGFPEPARPFSQPRWAGEDLAGRTIFLYFEQGIGDTIQFIRYVPLLAQRGARVIVECQQPLMRLLRNVPGISAMIARDEPPPAFDLHLPMMSLPGVFGTRSENIPASVPYIAPDLQAIEQWHRRIERKPGILRVGLTWAGSPSHVEDRRRSIALSAFAPLARVPGIEFYSLQKGAAAAQLPPPGMNLIDLTADLDDFADTAGFIANLDLIITVDTATAHLAGAMGKPTWILLPTRPDWRWLLDRVDSPWYPTARLFRQTTRGEWKPVIERAAKELAVCRGTGKVSTSE